MAKTREDFVAEGSDSAVRSFECAPTGQWTGALPVFGEGKSWQAKAFAEGWMAQAELIQRSVRLVAELKDNGITIEEPPCCAALGAPKARYQYPATMPDGRKGFILVSEATHLQLERAAKRAKIRAERVERMAGGYLTAALWSSGGEPHPETGEELESLEEFEPSPELRAHALRTCGHFYDRNMTDLAAFVDLYPSRVSTEYDPWEAAGHDLWLTRAGHGVGFWDRGMGRVGKRLSDECGFSKPFDNVDVYLGDDLLVYYSPAYHAKFD